jgi:predicted DNA-binding protein YlxM (UPF0122 family)
MAIYEEEQQYITTMKTVPERIDTEKLLEKISLRINQAVYRVNVGLTLTEDQPLVTESLSSLTVQEILDKIKDFLNSDPIDEHNLIFLYYLAKYPVSMCKRKVSPILKYLIGFHYRLGQMLKKDYGKVSPVSMEDLAEIFGRSKATVHDCIRETEGAWKGFLELKKKHEEIEAKAERELVEEAKERLRKEKAAESQVLKK